MREKLPLAFLYVVSFLLVLALTFIMIPILYVTPIFFFSIFVILVENIITPLFNMFTPLGGVLLLVLIIMGVLRFVLKKPNTRAAACFMPGVGGVCAMMEYAKKDKDEFVEFYTEQGLILFGITLIIFVTSMVFLRFGGPIWATLGYYIISLQFIVGGLLLIYMIYKAYSGEKVTLIPTSSSRITQN